MNEKNATKKLKAAVTDRDAAADKAMARYEKDFRRVAVDLLGTGYVPDYYETTVVPELRWAFREGFKCAYPTPAPRRKGTK